MKNFKFQISNFKFIAIAIIGIAFSSCSLLNGDKDPQFKLSDLQGLWEENGTQHYVRFTTEASDEAGYLYGREWDEAEEVYEEDLTPHGNGWFKYKFETKGDLHEIHLMDNGGAEIPKEYIVTELTSTTLKYHEKDRTSNKFAFSKMVVK